MTTAQIASLVVSILSLLGLGTLCSLYVTDKYKERKKNKEDIDNMKANVFEASLRKVIREENSELKQSVTELKTDMHSLKKGMQAGLRYNLMEIYNKAMVQGFCPQEDKDDFENIYKNYHALGKNGVMDTNREKLLALPDSKPIKKNKK